MTQAQQRRARMLLAAMTALALFSMAPAAAAVTTPQQNRTATAARHAPKLPGRRATRSDLAGRRWVARHYRTDGTTHRTAPGAPIRMNFGKVRHGHRALPFGFDTGCNAGGGAVVVRHGRLRFRRVIETDIACTGTRGEQESAFDAIIRARPRARMSHHRLVLIAGTTVITFQRHRR